MIDRTIAVEALSSAPSLACAAAAQAFFLSGLRI